MSIEEQQESLLRNFVANQRAISQKSLGAVASMAAHNIELIALLGAKAVHRDAMMHTLGASDDGKEKDCEENTV